MIGQDCVKLLMRRFVSLRSGELIFAVAQNDCRLWPLQDRLLTSSLFQFCSSKRIIPLLITYKQTLRIYCFSRFSALGLNLVVLTR